MTSLEFKSEAKMEKEKRIKLTLTVSEETATALEEMRLAEMGLERKHVSLGKTIDALVKRAMNERKASAYWDGVFISYIVKGRKIMQRYLDRRSEKLTGD